MMKLFLSLLLIFFSLLMFFIKHPLAMGLFILVQSIIISIFLGMFLNTYWFSYILFMIFMGGLLVLFIYVSSIASNEMMKFSFNLKMSFFFICIFSFLMTILLMNNLNLLNLFINNEMDKFPSMMLFFNENYLNLSKLYNNQNYTMTMLMIVYLFITLIAVIKITNIFFGPLRSFN